MLFLRLQIKRRCLSLVNGTKIVNVRTYVDLNDEERKIVVKGIELPPTSTDPSYQFSDLDNKGLRGYLDGVLKRNRIRKNVMSINNLSWSELPAEVAEEIIALVDEQSFTVNVYDRTQKKRVNKTMYRSADMTYDEIKYVGGYVSTLSFSLIEC